MHSDQHNNLQSRPHVQKLRSMYEQSSLPHVKLPTPPESDTASSNGNGSDSDNNGNVELDYNIAVTSAVASAILLRDKDAMPALSQIHSSLQTQNEYSTSMRKAFEGKIGDLVKRVDDLKETVDDLVGKVDSSAKELHGIIRTQQQHSTTLQYLMGSSDNVNNRGLNKLRYKLYHKIEQITAFRHNPDVKRCEWWAHPSFPKHLKAFRDLGNRAKGQWTVSEQKLSSQQRDKYQAKALDTINELCDFYTISVLRDDKSESDATQVMMVMPQDVDEIMEALGDVLGLNWEVIAKIPDEDTPEQAKKRRHHLLGYATEEHAPPRKRTE